MANCGRPVDRRARLEAAIGSGSGRDLAALNLLARLSFKHFLAAGRPGRPRWVDPGKEPGFSGAPWCYASTLSPPNIRPRWPVDRWGPNWVKTIHCADRKRWEFPTFGCWPTLIASRGIPKIRESAKFNGRKSALVPRSVISRRQRRDPPFVRPDPAGAPESGKIINSGGPGRPAPMGLATALA
jgi:hypothetical protein